MCNALRIPLALRGQILVFADRGDHSVLPVTLCRRLNLRLYKIPLLTNRRGSTGCPPVDGGHGAPLVNVPGVLCIDVDGASYAFR